MSLERQKRCNKILRVKVQEMVKTLCKESDVKKENEYHIFVNGRNTGEVVKVPDIGNEIEALAKEIGATLNKKISLTHRNMYINEC